MSDRFTRSPGFGSGFPGTARPRGAFRKGPTLLATLALALSACDSAPHARGLVDPSGGNSSATQALESGNDPSAAAEGSAEFRFLPPLGPDVEDQVGEPVPGLEPVVEICSLGGCDEPLARFTVEGTGAERVRFDDEGGYYVVHWRPADQGAAPGDRFIVQVSLGDGVVGSTRVFVAPNTGAQARAAAGDDPLLVVNRLAAIRFALTRNGGDGDGNGGGNGDGGGDGDGEPDDGGDPGDDPGDDPDRGSALIGPEGGVVRVGGITLVVPEGAISAEMGEVEVSVTRQEDPDIPGLPLISGSMVRLSPSPISFQVPVILTLPFDPEELPEGVTPSDLEIRRLEADGSTTLMPSRVDEAGGVVSAELSSFTLLLIVYNAIPIKQWVGGAPGEPRNWHNSANWSPAGVPTDVDPVRIPATATVFPQTTDAASVFSLEIQPGAALELGGRGIAVIGNVVSEGTFTSAGGLLAMDGDGIQEIRGSVPNLWVANGITRLSGNLAVGGDVLVAGTLATLDVGAHRLEVEGGLETTGTEGRLLMTVAQGHVVVNGTARFGASWPGDAPLRAGTLELRGDLVQVQRPDAFRATGNHTTVLASSSGAQTVSFQDPGPDGSFLSDLRVDQSGVVNLGSGLRARTLSFGDAGIGGTVSGPGQTLWLQNAFLRGNLSLSELRVDGDLAMAGSFAYDVEHTVFTGADTGPEFQGMADLPFRNVTVESPELRLIDPFVTVGGDLVLAGGTLRVNGRILGVEGSMRSERGGQLRMEDGDRVVVAGSTFWEGGTPFLTGGTLWVGGDFDAGATPLGTQPAHTLVMFGQGAQALRGETLVLGRVALTNTGEGVTIEARSIHGFGQNPELRLLDLVGRTRVDAGDIVSVGNIVYRSSSVTHFANLSAFNCHVVWTEPGATLTSDWQEIGCYRFLAAGAAQDRPAPADYTPPSRLRVLIDAPEPGASFRVGTSVDFQARAEVSGAPAQAGFRWFSSRDGLLGEGSSFSRSDLSVGTHVIEVVAETAEGITGVASTLIAVTADDRLGLEGSALAVRAAHACALDAEGQAWCWGANTHGQLGTGTTNPSLVPVQVAGGHRFVDIAVGNEHTCALADSGTIFCWGFNSAGQLGTGNLENQSLPTALFGDRRFMQVATGHNFSCGIEEGTGTAGAAYCWGANTVGQVGDGTTSTRYWVPRLVSGGRTYTALTAGQFFSCALAESGETWCWGDNRQWQLGSGNTTSTSFNTPQLVTGSHAFTSVSAGADHACGLLASGEAWCWGGNGSGRLGIGSTLSGSANPQRVNTTETFAGITAGYQHTCAWRADGAAFCWGSNANGQLGDGTTTTFSRLSPAPGAEGLRFQQMRAGESHTCALATTDVAYCWGSGADGRLGNGSTEVRPEPEPVAAPGG
jgi:alpha-tubulin suppressor-like RCC1 family protein